MAARPAGAVPIAPSRTEGTPPTGSGRPRAVASSDIVFANGQAFNGRGYRVCGVANQRGTLCGRIGTCPFHAGQTPGMPNARVPKRRRSRTEPATPASTAEPVAKVARQDTPPSAAVADASGVLPECVRRMDTPPTKSRFKRSWTPAEHRQFLQSMKKFGKGKWKEISREVKTRTANQCQSHAQKYFLRQAKTDAERKKKSIHDLTDEAEETLTQNTKTEQLPAAEPVETTPNTPANGDANAATTPGTTPRTLPPFLYDATDTHPCPPGMEALASVAVAAAGAGRRESLNAALRAALSNNAPSEGASQVSAAHTSKLETHVTQNGGKPPDEEADADAEEDVTTDRAPPAGAPQSMEVQALALAALAAAAMNGTETAPASAEGATKAGATVPIMVPMSALQGPFSQLMSNPQTLMYLNPLLNSMGALNRAAAPAPPPPPPPPRLRVTVHRNGCKGGGMALMLPETMREFFALGKNLLGFDGVFQRVFTRSGGEITSLDQMVQDDALWLSRGEEFATPT